MSFFMYKRGLLEGWAQNVPCRTDNHICRHYSRFSTHHPCCVTRLCCPPQRLGRASRQYICANRICVWAATGSSVIEIYIIESTLQCNHREEFLAPICEVWQCFC